MEGKKVNRFVDGYNLVNACPRRLTFGRTIFQFFPGRLLNFKHISRNMSESGKYLLLGILLTLSAVAILMPYMARGGSAHAYWGPYYAHGGREYKPGVLY